MPDGPLLGGQLALRKVPGPAWLDANPGVDHDEATDADMVVQVAVVGTLTRPSAVVHPGAWKRGVVPIVELACVPYLDFVAAADADIARQEGREPVSVPTPLGFENVEPGEAGAATDAAGEETTS